MKDFTSPSAGSADALSREVQALVLRHLNGLFDASVAVPAPMDLAGQVATGAFSPLIEQIRGPVQGLMQREGLLIQGVLAPALKATLGMTVLPTVRITVTESDRDLVAGNVHGDLSELSPPRANDETGRVEIDILGIERNGETFWVIDCKRTPRGKDGDRRRLVEASLAAKRRLRRDGLPCRKAHICLVRWYSGDDGFALDPTVATNETVDQLFDAPVRKIVDAALKGFKDGVNARIETLLARAMSATPPMSDPVRPQPPAPIADLDALRRALTSDRSGRRA